MLRSAFRQASSVFGMTLRIVGFVLETVILGGIFLWRIAHFLQRLPMVFATEIECPRGHRVPLDGLTRCASCGAMREGSLMRCPVCGATPSFLVCPACGLAVGNPLR